MGAEEPTWRQAAAQMLHASLVLRTEVEEQLVEQMGLLLADNEALLNLAAEDGLRMSEVADRLVLSRGGTTKVIDRLEAMGYVARRADPDDRRATVVEITPAGRDAMAAARLVVDEVLGTTWRRHVNDEEARVVVDVMTRVLDASKR